MDAGTIGKLVQKHRATMIISTPSFCAGYARKCSVEQFATLRYAVVGAEKLREPIARAFKGKYGLDLLEAYGWAVERADEPVPMSPVEQIVRTPGARNVQ